MSAAEREFQISPIVPESVMHNTKTLSNLQSLTSSVFGAAAGILGLESYAGFLFYFAFTALTAALFYAVRVAPQSLFAPSSPSSSSSSNQKGGGGSSNGGGGGGGGFLDTTRFFRTRYEMWTSGLFAGLPGYVLTWTLFYGLVRA